MTTALESGAGILSRFDVPLYTVAEALSALKLLRPVAYHETLAPAEAVNVCFHDAGHILGSAWLEVTVCAEGRPRRLVFSGDLGMPGRPVLCDPEKVVPEADLLRLAEAAGWAPSGHNSQPWEFVAVDDDATIDAIAASGLSMKVIGTSRATAIVAVSPGSAPTMKPNSEASITASSVSGCRTSRSAGTR